MSMDFPAPTAIGQIYTNSTGVTYEWDGEKWVAQGGAGGGGGGTAPVTSVNAKIGDVVLSSADVGAAPVVHAHVIGDVTNLQTSLDGKAPLGIVSTADPDPAQGVEGTVWYKVA